SDLRMTAYFKREPFSYRTQNILTTPQRKFDRIRNFAITREGIGKYPEDHWRRREASQVAMTSISALRRSAERAVILSMIFWTTLNQAITALKNKMFIVHTRMTTLSISVPTRGF